MLKTQKCLVKKVDAMTCASLQPPTLSGLSEAKAVKYQDGVASDERC